MNTLPPPLRIANTAAVLDGPYGAVTRQANRCGTSRQALYRDAPKVLQAVDGSQSRQRLQELQDDYDRLRAECDRLHRQLQQAVVAEADCRARFAATAQAEGVSLPVARRLLRPLLAQQPPSVAQLGRWSHAAAQQAAALLPLLDAAARPQVEQVAADEIFFGRRPCLMVVEQHRLCWLTGRLADNRDGDTWAEEFRSLPNLHQVTRDGGTGLAKGVAQVNEERQARTASPACRSGRPFSHAARRPPSLTPGATAGLSGHRCGGDRPSPRAAQGASDGEPTRDGHGHGPGPTPRGGSSGCRSCGGKRLGVDQRRLALVHADGGVE